MPSIIITPANSEPIALAEAKNHLRVDDSTDDLLITALIAAARQQVETVTRRQLMAAQWKIVLDKFPSPSLETSAANWYGPAWGVGPGPLTAIGPSGKTGFEIFLMYPPIISVDSIKYIDPDGVQQTLNASAYLVDAVSEPARVTPAFGTAWPSTRNQAGAVEIAFTCGYASLATANATADTLTTSGPAKAFVEGDIVRFANSGGALPGGLTLKTNYFVRNPSGASFQLAASLGGSVIDISSAGSGITFAGEVPETIKAWMLLRIGVMYENREEVSVGQRIVVNELPFVDRLLDPYRVVTF